MRVFIYISLLLWVFKWALHGQQIALKGVITLQNSRGEHTQGKPVPGVWISHPNAKPQVSDSQGRFTLYFSELKQGEEIALSIKPQGAYKDYLVINAREMQHITLGRTKPLSIYICSKEELEARRAKLIGINIEQYRASRSAVIQALKTRIAHLQTEQADTNEQYQKALDSLRLLEQDEDRTLKRIRHYAEQLSLINIDEADEIYRSAYHLFEQGHLDSLSTYLELHLHYEDEVKHIHEQELKIQHDQELSQKLRHRAKQMKENAQQAKQSLAEKLLLSARAYALRYRYDEATERYAQLIRLNARDLFHHLNEAATFAHSVHDYLRAESYLLDALYLASNKKPQRARTLNNIGVLYQELQMPHKAEPYLREALPIWEAEASKKPKQYAPHLARCLNNLGVVANRQGEYLRAVQYLLQALAIREDLAQERHTQALHSLAKTLSALGTSYQSLGREEQAIRYLLRALAIHDELKNKGLSLVLADLSKVLNNLGVLYSLRKNFGQAEQYLNRALEQVQVLAKHKLKTYERELARIVHNLGVCYARSDKPQQAEEMLKRAITLRRQLSEQHPKLYQDKLINSLKHLNKLYPKHKPQQVQALSQEIQRIEQQVQETY